jgi:capsular polysaccharide export protein
VQRILFISAPFGPFFRRAAEALSQRGHEVWRVVWDGGDFIESPLSYQLVYRGGASLEEDFLRRVLRDKHITTVITYNDTSRRNRIALKLARELGIHRYVLENGYLRPHWITLEREGVNGYSRLPKDPEFYESFEASFVEPVIFPVSMRDHVRNTIKHFAASIAFSPFLSFDTRYYGHSLWRQARHYAKEYFWRIAHTERDKAAEIAKRKKNEAPKVFVVLLQKPGDAQLCVHSQYDRNRPFLTEVCESFVRHAPKSAILVVKQHPYDYGVERLPAFFKALVIRLGIGDRAYYFRKTSIDIVLDQSDGLVTVNSTGGLSAVVRGLPVLCCGHAIFNMAGLTFRGGLDQFWHEASPPDALAVRRFINYLQTHSQINGGFHHPVGMELAANALSLIINENSLAPHHELAYAATVAAHTQTAGKIASSLVPVLPSLAQP